MDKIEQVVKIIIVILLVAALVGGIGYMVWFFGFKPSTDKPNGTDPTKPGITVPMDIEIDKEGVIF